ncbi:MAG: hypothetical protein PHE84_11000, partial [bacterium]|nr:hypothetical protein [bacterium]
SECRNDSDLIPPSAPELLTPADGSAFHALPITFSWTVSSDNCRLSAPGAYQISLLNMSDPYANPITVATDSAFYQMNSSSFLVRNYRWWVRARDASGNYSAPSLPRQFTFYPEEISRETFDSAILTSNWTSGDEDSAGGDDHWGKADKQSHSGMYSAWCAADGTQSNDECGAVGASNLSIHKYDNEMKAFLEMVFYPGGHSLLTLSFWYWLEIADPDDCLKVRAKDQAGAWSDLWQICRQSNGWAMNDYVDLSSFSGQAKIAIQFLFESDGSGHCAEGAYLDDIVVEGW